MSCTVSLLTAAGLLGPAASAHAQVVLAPARAVELPDVPACPNSGARPATKCELWSRTPASPFGAGAGPKGIAVAADGGTVFVTGYVSILGLSIGTAAFDSTTGQTLWSAAYHDAALGWGQGMDVVAAPDGSAVYVTGFDRSGVTLAYDAATGAELWRANWTNALGYGAVAHEIGIDPAGARVFVGGYAWFGEARSDDYLVLAYDAQSGALLWEYAFSGAGAVGHHGDLLWDLAVSPDGTRVAATGGSAGERDGPTGPSYRDLTTVVIDAASGVQVWASTFDGPGFGTEQAQSVRFSPDGSRVFATGEAWAGQYDWATIAYDVASGAIEWTAKRGASTNNDYPLSLAVSPDSTRVFVTGTDTSLAVTGDMMTAAYDASMGAEVWAARYSQPKGDKGWAVAVTPDGSRVLVAGESQPPWGSLDYDNLVVSYDAATGLEKWVGIWGGPPTQFFGWTDQQQVMALSPDGSRVFTSAMRFRLSGLQPGEDGWLTVAYDTSDPLAAR